MTLPPGTRLGFYEIVAPLGAGGMGEVYRARDSRLGREVAIKILPSETAGEISLARFEREARALATLSHPNVLSIYELARDHERTYLVTELLEGVTLRSLIEDRELTTERSLKIVTAIADGLAAAHDKGIIHRDLKPENVFITPGDRVKILDFGLARTLPTPADNDQQETGNLLSAPGTIIGTAGYMSPEQLRGDGVTPASDIFALGCILYEMLAGKRPFTGASAAEMVAAVLRGEPDLSAIPAAVTPIVRHALEKKREARYQSAHDLAFALRSVAAGRPGRRYLLAGALAAALAVVVSILLLAWPRPPARNSPTQKITSIAIMPFTNESRDPRLDYLGDGISEMVINSLSPLPGLRVMSRDSAFQYRGKAPDEIGRELAVDAVVTGRIRRAGDLIVVGAELVDARDQHQIWGERHTERSSDVFKIESEIARRISESLELQLRGEDERRLRQRSTSDPLAYSLYLQGRYEWNKRTPEGLRAAINLFQQAIDRDPNYSLAHAGLAEAYVLLGSLYGVVPPKESMPVARAAALRALSIDPGLAAPHATLGVVEHEFNWNWPAAEEQFRKAIQINPNYATGHHWYGMFLVYRGRFEEGLAEVRRAESLDPLSMVIKADIAQALFMAHRFDEAIRQARAVIDLAPGFWLPHLLLGLASAEKGMTAEATAAIEKAVELGGHDGAVGSLAVLYTRSGRRKEAEALLRRTERDAATRYVPPFTFFALHAGMGDYELAFAALDRAFEERSGFITVLEVLPTLDPIRQDPRFRKRIERLRQGK